MALGNIISDGAAATPALFNARSQGVYNVAGYGALGDGTTDDTSAIQAAAAAALAANGVLFFPSGIFRYSARLLNITARMSVVGAGKRNTFLKPLSSYTGYAFTVTDCWRNSVEEASGTTITLGSTSAGVQFRDLSIVGDLATAAKGIQTAGVVDFLYMDEVDLLYLKGTALQIGETTVSGSGFVHGVARECRFNHVRIQNCGNLATSEPALHITCNSSGASDGTNQLWFHDLVVLYSNGIGILIENETTTETLRRIYINGMMLHGHGAAASAVAADLMHIKGGPMQNIHMTNVRMNGSHSGYAGIRIGANDAGHIPQRVFIELDMASCTGDGIVVDSVNTLTVNGTVDPNSITGTELTVTAVTTFVEYNVKGPGTRTVTIASAVFDKVHGTWDNDLHFGGGYRQTLEGWYYDNVAATLVTTPMNRLAAGTQANALIMPRAGSVTCLAAWSSEACTAGECYVKVWKSTDNGATWAILTDITDSAEQMATGFSTTNTRFNHRTRKQGLYTFARGDLLRVEISSTGAWAPVTADVRAIVEIET